ncbi:MAG TPA: hypothetical protein VN033_08875 [Vulgatibacter sp.]|nr:hypothetical protein [Vulgatibacter sp.]
MTRDDFLSRLRRARSDIDDAESSAGSARYDLEELERDFENLQADVDEETKEKAKELEAVLDALQRHRVPEVERIENANRVLSPAERVERLAVRLAALETTSPA